jgi:hypothetical protein
MGAVNRYVELTAFNRMKFFTFKPNQSLNNLNCFIGRMPKDELHLLPLREVRGKKRKAHGNTHPSIVYFQVELTHLVEKDPLQVTNDSHIK